jgi:hypothetical protein
MPLRWHVDLPGPVAYSRPIRRRGKKPGCLVSVLVWFIVKPLGLTVRGLAALFQIRRKPTVEQRMPFGPPGLYHPSRGPMFWNGVHWLDRDGRVIQ